MGLKNWLFRRKKTLARDDPDFGRIEFDHGMWCSIPSDPRWPFMLVVDAVEAGPCERQRQFLRWITDNLALYEKKGREFVDRHRSDAEKLAIYSLEIPVEAELKCGIFTIEYSDKQADTIYRASFVEFEPRHYGEDD